MKKLCSLACLTAIICLPALAEQAFDKKEKINGVNLQTGKVASVRHYEGSFTHSFPNDLDLVKNAITNFSEKCNNTYKTKRVLLDREVDCKYHVEQLVESQVIKLPQETDRYLVARHIYRRGSYSQYDLVQVLEGKNEKNQRTVTVTLRMLDDQEVEQYTKAAFKRESDFIRSTETFVLTAASKEKTDLHYSYYAETDHWLLNKQLSVPQVFASLSQNINDLHKTVEEAISSGRREVASRK